MAYTNTGLVEYAKKCLALGDNSVYVYGSYGNKLTTSFVDSKYRQYPNVNTTSRTNTYKKLCDGQHYGFDCVGLIKSYYWGGYGNVKYNGNSDVSANGMYDRAKKKGPINTMDKSKIGLLVQMNGHIGIYIGNDEVIECTISTYFAKQSHKMGGVCKTKLSDRKWVHWCECPYISYEDTPAPTPTPTPTPQPKSFFPAKGYWTYGDNHDNIGKMASFMYHVFPVYTKKEALGNWFGPNLTRSIKEFQRRTGLEPDGSVGPLTLAKLQYYGFKY